MGIKVPSPAEIELFRSRVVQHPERYFTILPDEGDFQEIQITYGELDCYAQAIDAPLQSKKVKGKCIPPNLSTRIRTFIDKFRLSIHRNGPM